MSRDLHTLIEVVFIDLWVGITGSVLSVGWLRANQGEWPDRDSIATLFKIWFGLAAFGIVGYLLAKYG